MSAKTAPLASRFDWSAPVHHLTAREWSHLGALAAIPVGLVAMAAVLGYGLYALPLVAAAIVAAYFGQGWLALARFGARPLADGAHPRLANIVAGVSADAGTPIPRLRVMPDGGPNAMVARTGSPVLAVTQSLLDTYSRTELEAVVAHCLIRLNAGGLWLSTVAACLGGLGRPFRPWIGDGDDVQAAALTRYPPALAAAILKAEPATGGFAPLFFVADYYSHVPAARRAEALADL